MLSTLALAAIYIVAWIVCFAFSFVLFVLSWEHEHEVDKEALIMIGLMSSIGPISVFVSVLFYFVVLVANYVYYKVYDE